MKRPKLSGWVWVAIFLTAVYAATAWYILSSSLPTMTSCSEGQLILLRACLTLNEVGDLAAGLFAPVAFIWLAVAVLVQAQELNAQRDELKLTREELHEQRKVMKEQAEEAKRQAEFIGRQTEILAQEQSERDEKRADELVFEHIGSLRDWLNKEYLLLAPHTNLDLMTEPPGRGQTRDKPDFRKLHSAAFTADNQSAIRAVRQFVFGLVRRSDKFLWLHKRNYAVLRNFHKSPTRNSF